MQAVFQNIADYFKHGIAPPSFSELEIKFGREDLWVICIEILSWLRRQAVYKHAKGLELNTAAPWAEKLIQLVSTDPRFRKAFVINDGQLRFSPQLSDEEKIQVREWARQIYNPPMMK